MEQGVTITEGGLACEGVGQCEFAGREGGLSGG
jgi:hypothetical protein